MTVAGIAFQLRRAGCRSVFHTLSTAAGRAEESLAKSEARLGKSAPGAADGAVDGVWISSGGCGTIHEQMFEYRRKNAQVSSPRPRGGVSAGMGTTDLSRSGRRD
jgi:hypothetical protein